MIGERLIKNFGTRLGIKLKLDDSHSCSFEADNTLITITHLPETDEIVLLGDLGELPGANREPLLMKLLQGNYLFKETHGATFSVNTESKHIVLCRLFPAASMDDYGFFALTEQFVNVAEHYARILTAKNTEINSPSAYPPDPQNLNLLSV